MEHQSNTEQSIIDIDSPTPSSLEPFPSQPILSSSPQLINDSQIRKVPVEAHSTLIDIHIKDESGQSSSTFFVLNDQQLAVNRRVDGNNIIDIGDGDEASKHHHSNALSLELIHNGISELITNIITTRMASILTQNQALLMQNNALLKENEIIKAENEDLGNQYQIINGEQEHINQQYHEAIGLNHEKDQIIEENNKKIVQNDHLIAHLDNDKKNLVELNQHITNENQDLQQKIKELSLQSDILLCEKNDLVIEKTQLIDKCNDLKSKADQDWETNNFQINELMKTHKNSLTALEEEVFTKKTVIDKLEKERNRLSQQNSQFGNEIETFAEQKRNLIDELEDYKKVIIMPPTVLFANLDRPGRIRIELSVDRKGHHIKLE